MNVERKTMTIDIYLDDGTSIDFVVEGMGYEGRNYIDTPLGTHVQKVTSHVEVYFAEDMVKLYAADGTSFDIELGHIGDDIKRQALKEAQERFEKYF